jgi:hypothetical protein
MIEQSLSFITIIRELIRPFITIFRELIRFKRYISMSKSLLLC